MIYGPGIRSGLSNFCTIVAEMGIRVFAKELYDAKLLSEEGWKKVASGTQI